MADFNTAWQITGSNEGGYSNVANDLGGETYAGITRKNFPHWSGWSRVDAAKPLKQGQIIPGEEMSLLVAQFYKLNFWDPINGDAIELQQLANDAFDTAVNMGVSEALKLFIDA